MRNISDLIPAATTGKHVSVEMAQPPRAIDQGTASVVNSLFAELQCIFPAWKQAWPDEDSLKAAKRSWIKGFMAAGINSLEQIRFGIQQCRRSGGDFAPSVGRFIKWCEPTPEMLGLPDAAKAYREACANAHPAAERNWSHPAVHHAACETGFYELANLPEERSHKLFERNYAITVRAVMTGEPLREIPLALPETVTVCTPEIGVAALAALRAKVKA